MRPLPSTLLVAALALIAAPALADVGPPPKCGADEHGEYLYGHHCVPNGFHLVRDPQGGGTKLVSNSEVTRETVPSSPAVGSSATTTPSAAPTVPPPATNFASPPPPATAAAATTAAPATPAADPSPVPATPPPSRGCACTMSETGAGLGSVLAGVAALAAALRRRRPR